MSQLAVTYGYDEVAPDLTAQEQTFLYQIEVLGLPVLRAAEIAGVGSPYYLLKRPHMITAREQYRNAIRGDVDFSRDDVIFGIKEAVDQARILGDPTAQIAGWKEIAKLKGYDKTPQININLTGTVDQMRAQLATMSTDKLLELSGSNVLDGDFYRVNKERNDADANDE